MGVSANLFDVTRGGVEATSTSRSNGPARSRGATTASASARADAKAVRFVSRRRRSAAAASSREINPVATNTPANIPLTVIICNANAPMSRITRRELGSTYNHAAATYTPLDATSAPRTHVDVTSTLFTPHTTSSIHRAIFESSLAPATAAASPPPLVDVSPRLAATAASNAAASSFPARRIARRLRALDGGTDGVVTYPSLVSASSRARTRRPRSSPLVPAVSSNSSLGQRR